MGKKNRNLLPFVSVCTPTFNRRPFIPFMFECFRNQTYPKDRMEWIIIDDGTDKIKDLVDAAKIPQIKYFALPEKITLGKKRNMMHDKSCGAIIVYMDDDDYYPPERVSHAVEMLNANKKALCAGSSELYVFFKHINQMYQFGPYGPNHATAGTFAFRRELLTHTRYNEDACLAEEREFLKEYTIPFVQLEPKKTILVFSHEHNTFDKRKLLVNPHPQYAKVSDKTVDDFIKFNDETPTKRFFMNDIDGLLTKYKPGEPAMKPDVIKQTLEIESQRKKMEDEMRAQQSSQIMMQQPGKEPVALTPQDLVNIVRQQQAEIQALQAQNQEMQGIILELQKRVINSPDVGLNNAFQIMQTELQSLRKQNQELKNDGQVRELQRIIMELQKQLLMKPVSIVRNKSDPEQYA